jgi:hypothetical protein
VKAIKKPPELKKGFKFTTNGPRKPQKTPAAAIPNILGWYALLNT